jgi:diguanylate cyclase (GGDEF)-like protein
MAPDVRPRCAVLICDVVGLKAVNEGRGFRAGDAVLATAARVLVAEAAGADVVARLGGDEFVAVFSGPSADADARRAAARLAACAEPRLRSATAIATASDTPGVLIDRLYATMRAS